MCCITLEMNSSIDDPVLQLVVICCAFHMLVLADGNNSCAVPLGQYVNCLEGPSFCLFLLLALHSDGLLRKFKKINK